MLVVEYFCDKEKTELHIHETKELQVSRTNGAGVEGGDQAGRWRVVGRWGWCGGWKPGC